MFSDIPYHLFIYKGTLCIYPSLVPPELSNPNLLKVTRVMLWLPQEGILKPTEATHVFPQPLGFRMAVRLKKLLFPEENWNFLSLIRHSESWGSQKMEVASGRRGEITAIECMTVMGLGKSPRLSNGAKTTDVLIHGFQHVQGVQEQIPQG